MKTLLSLLTLSTLSTSLASNVSGFLSNESNNNHNLNHSSGVLSVWKIPNLDLNFSNVVALNNTIWASSSTVPPYSEKGLYKSTDDSTFNKSSVIGEMNSIVSRKDGTLYLSDDDILYNSNNNGETFTRIEPFEGGKDCIGINSKDEIFVGSSNKLYQSTDGINFNKIYEFDSSLNITKIVFAPNDTMYILLGSSLHRYVAKSINSEYTNFTQIPDIDFVSDIAVGADNAVYIAGTSLYKSTNNGNNFVAIPGSDEISVTSLSITKNNLIYCQTGNAIWQFDANNSFSKIWNFTERILSISVAANGIIWIGTDEGLFKIIFN